MNFVELPFVKAFLLMIRDTLDFRGRTSRSNFWWATLGVIILTAAVGFVCGLLGPLGEFLSWLLGVILWIPEISMGVRRLHDTGKSGLWMLISFTVIGCILLIIWWAMKGQEGDNFYGPDPESPYGY